MKSFSAIVLSRLCAVAGVCSVVMLLLAGCATFTPNGEASARATQLQAGIAEMDITPPIGFRMAGYFSERCSAAIHDLLKAKALVLRQGREQVAMVFCDLVGLSLNVTKKARVLASRQTGIPASPIVIAATPVTPGRCSMTCAGIIFIKPHLQKAAMGRPLAV